MTINEKYISAILPSLSPYRTRRFRDGTGYVLACPFCGDAQKRESKKNEMCAALTPLANSYQWVFNCQRGLNGGKGNDRCFYTMRLDTFLQQWNPPLYRQYLREKQVVTADLNHKPVFKRDTK